MLKTPDNFIIVHRDSSAQPDSIYPPDGRLAACIAKSINYSQGYLRLARVQDAFISYAEEYAQLEPNAWYKNPVCGYKNVQHVVIDFINTVLADFFLTCIDSTITNPNCLAGTGNREWHGRFSPRDHCISLNASVRERPSSLRPYRLINAKRDVESRRHGCSSDESNILNRSQRLR